MEPHIDGAYTQPSILYTYSLCYFSCVRAFFYASPTAAIEKCKRIVSHSGTDHMDSVTDSGTDNKHDNKHDGKHVGRKCN